MTDLFRTYENCFKDANDIEQTGRRDGTTTQQIIAAPANAVYVMMNDRDTEYASKLASTLGRSDLQFHNIRFFTQGVYRGRWRSQIVVDHSVWELSTVGEYKIICEALDSMSPGPRKSEPKFVSPLLDTGSLRDSILRGGF